MRLQGVHVLLLHVLFFFELLLDDLFPLSTELVLVLSDLALQFLQEYLLGKLPIKDELNVEGLPHRDVWVSCLFNLWGKWDGPSR